MNMNPLLSSKGFAPLLCDCLKLSPYFGVLLCVPGQQIYPNSGLRSTFGSLILVFEPAHGSSPKYKGQDKINPTATVLSAAWMLQYLGDKKSGDAIFEATEKVISEGKSVTYDLGGTSKTSEMTSKIIKYL